MKTIITLTVNPVVDKNTAIANLVPHRKLRCTEPRYYAGGGGINVSRAIKNLGGASLSVFLAGGRTGEHLQELLGKEDIPQKVVELSGATRENFSVMDASTALHYRFASPGPVVAQKEWKASLYLVEKNLKANDFLVASGKLTSGIPDDYYLKLDEIVKDKNAQLILDTKGEALKHAVKNDIFLFKPNLSELASLYQKEFVTFKTIEKIAKDFMETHTCKILAVSLGCRSALLVTPKSLEYVPAPVVEERNSIGAGDSMVAGMLLKVQEGHTPKTMVQYGVAAGASATMRKGSQLCRKEEVDKIFDRIKQHSLQ